MIDYSPEGRLRLIQLATQKAVITLRGSQRSAEIFIFLEIANYLACKSTAFLRANEDQILVDLGISGDNAAYQER